MSRKTGIWTMNSSGNMKYVTEQRVLKRRYKPGTLFERPAAAYITLVICAVIDFVLFYQMFSKILYDSPGLLVISIAAMIVGFDFDPVYLGIKWKQHRQGYNVDMLMIYALAAIFVLAFTANFAMRIVMRDIALPDLSASTSSILGGVQETVKNPLAPAYSVLVAVMPLVTSVVSFAISNATYDPLLSEKRMLEESKLMLDEDINITESMLREYASDSDMLERMTQDDDNRYDSAAGVIYTRSKFYGDYVRERIKEHMGEAAASNELSKAGGEAFLERLDETVGIYRVDPGSSVIRRMITERSKTDI